MTAVKNVSDGPRGAYLKGSLVMANVGEEIEADDFSEDWFEEVGGKSKAPAKAKPDPEPAAKKS